MGGVVGGIVSGVGSYMGARAQAKAAERSAELQLQASREASEAALTGYRYLTEGDGAQPIQSYIDRGQEALGQQTNALNMQAQLLGAQPVTPETQQAFADYRDSSGYQFMMDEGTNAIMGTAGARGLRGSGATARGLTEFGQGLADTTFNNYLAQLSGLGAQFGGQAEAGRGAIGQVASAGSAGGGGAANALTAGAAGAGNAMVGAGNARASGIAGMASNFGNALSSGVDFFTGGGGGFGRGASGSTISPAASNAIAAGRGGLF